MEFWRLSAAEIVVLARRRDASAGNVTAGALARLDAVVPALNEIVGPRYRKGALLAGGEAIGARGPAIRSGDPVSA
ncbi:hypothetical protein [Roseomonas indoligenes]|uniref:Amidase n=1 Tax=Roseomonas indoligenes TaxID=2820811 RepID=A0A940N501_9PROT|nr:hypothetical protein [Pararoseomonas indoligenes]MBP0496081.1 hypothetical protein [Pararoseomonas indoligenes]